MHRWTDEPRAAEPAEEEREPEKLWQVTELQAAALAGVLLLAGYGFDWAGYRIPALTLQSLALLVGAWTFVPGGAA